MAQSRDPVQTVDERTKVLPCLWGRLAALPVGSRDGGKLVRVKQQH